MQAVVVTNPLFLMLASLSWNTVPKFELQTIKTQAASREKQEKHQKIAYKERLYLFATHTNKSFNKTFQGPFQSCVP